MALFDRESMSFEVVAEIYLAQKMCLLANRQFFSIPNIDAAITVGLKHLTILYDGKCTRQQVDQSWVSLIIKYRRDWTNSLSQVLLFIYRKIRRLEENFTLM